MRKKKKYNGLRKTDEKTEREHDERKTKTKFKQNIKTVEDETQKNRSKMLGRARLSRTKMKKKHTSKIRKKQKSKLIDKLLLVVR